VLTGEIVEAGKAVVDGYVGATFTRPTP